MAKSLSVVNATLYVETRILIVVRYIIHSMTHSSSCGHIATCAQKYRFLFSNLLNSLIIKANNMHFFSNLF
jgi:hypothetical protein